MQNELYRLATFCSWSASCNVSPLLLAKCGFHYLGMSKAVECFMCKAHLDDWSGYDILQEMHKQKAPQCQLLIGNTKMNMPLEITATKITGRNGNSVGDTEADLAILEPDRSNTVESVPLKRILDAAYKRACSKGVFSSSADCKIDRSRPDYDKLRKEEVRLVTFHDWPPAARANPQALAQAGFIYTGEGDRVQCAFCRGFIRNWEPTDIPSVEHKKHFPDCPFVRGQDIGNVPIERKPVEAGHKTVNEDVGQKERVFQERLMEENLRESTRTCTREQLWQSTPMNNYEEPAKFPEYANVVNRVNSFVRGRVSDGHTAEGLADAGWFWIGPGDKVQCFQCGGNLKEWEPEDDPWDEHKRWYANCPYLKKHGPTPSRQLQEPARPTIAPIVGPYHVEPREVKARMDTATVRAIVNMGYPKDRIKMAIEKRLCTTGDDFPNAESLLEALFQLEEAGKHSNGAAASGASSVPVAAAESRITSSGSIRSSFSDNGYGTMSSSSSTVSAGSHHHDSFVSLPPSKEPLSLASSSAATFQSLVLTPSEKLSSVPGVTATAAPAVDVSSDTQAKSKGKRKRNKKKKANPALNETIGEEVETLTGAQNDPEKSTVEGELNLEEIPDEESIKYLEENRQLREARTCKVCMDAEVNTVFLPCGHLVCCHNCSPLLRNCPICRTFIRGTVKTFLS